MEKQRFTDRPMGKPGDLTVSLSDVRRHASQWSRQPPAMDEIGTKVKSMSFVDLGQLSFEESLFGDLLDAHKGLINRMIDLNKQGHDAMQEIVGLLQGTADIYRDMEAEATRLQQVEADKWQRGVVDLPSRGPRQPGPPVTVPEVYGP